MNSASWTNQGPQQWDQTSSVVNQGGQFPHSAMPQEQYTQIDQNVQLQNGTVFYSKKLNLLHNVVLYIYFLNFKGASSLAMCSSRKYPYPHHRGDFI